MESGGGAAKEMDEVCCGISLCDAMVVKLKQVSLALFGVNVIWQQMGPRDEENKLAVICLVVEALDSMCRDMDHHLPKK